MAIAVGSVGPEWVWVQEVVSLIDRRLAVEGLSLSEYARRVSDRFGLGAETVERRVRAARRSQGVMNIHTADRYLVLLDCHLRDLPSYRDAVDGVLPRDQWPRRS